MGGLSTDPAKRDRQLSNLKPNAHGSHGCYDIARLAPVRERHEQELLRDYPHLDGRRRAILADRLARFELATAWVQEHGIVRSRRGDAFPIVDRLERWGARCEDMIGQAEAEDREARQPTPATALQAHLEQRYGSGNGRTARAAMAARSDHQRESNRARASRQRQERLEEMRRQLASGELVVRRASKAEREQWQREREQAADKARRVSALVPLEGEASDG